MATVTKLKTKNAATVGWYQQCVHRSRNEVFSEVKTIGPQMAEMLLSQNPDNRSIRPSKMMQMASDMKDGRWAFNGEPIIIAKSGELNDGQHRLGAVVEAGVEVPMLFVFGLERDTRTTLDQGANRTPADYLSMEGIQHAAQAASIARQLIAFEAAGRSSLGRTNEVSAARTLERVKTDQGVIVAARFGNTHSRRASGFASPTVIGFCYYIFLTKDVNDGMSFMHQLVTGEELRQGDPVLTARNRLAALERKSRAVQTEIIFRAWNGYREQRKMSTIPVHGRLPDVI